MINPFLNCRFQHGLKLAGHYVFTKICLPSPLVLIYIVYHLYDTINIICYKQAWENTLL